MPRNQPLQSQEPHSYYLYVVDESELMKRSKYMKVNAFRRRDKLIDGACTVHRHGWAADLDIGDTRLAQAETIRLPIKLAVGPSEGNPQKTQCSSSPGKSPAWPLSQHPGEKLLQAGVRHSHYRPRPSRPVGQFQREWPDS